MSLVSGNVAIRQKRGYRPDVRPRLPSSLTCCCRSGPGSSWTPKPAAHESRRSVRALVFEHLPDHPLAERGMRKGLDVDMRVSISLAMSANRHVGISPSYEDRLLHGLLESRHSEFVTPDILESMNRINKPSRFKLRFISAPFKRRLPPPEHLETSPAARRIAPMTDRALPRLWLDDRHRIVIKMQRTASIQWPWLVPSRVK